MKQLLVLAAVVVAAQSLGKWDPGLKVRFDISLIGAGRSYFIPVPQTLTAAKNSRWVESPRPDGQPRSSLVLYNPSIDDVVLGAFYDSTGKVAGLQIALPQDTITNTYFDWVTQGFTEWTAPADSSGNVRTYWTTAVYFVSDATLAKSPEERSTRIYEEDYIYVTSFDGALMPISTVASEVADTPNTYFTKQACIPLMGRHYYYNMTVLTECTSRGMLPWFPLVDPSSGSNQLIGLGFITVGNLPASSLKRDYFERPAASAVRTIVPDGPNCLYQLATDYSLLTMHIYFIDSPLLINCIFM